MRQLSTARAALLGALLLLPALATTAGAQPFGRAGAVTELPARSGRAGTVLDVGGTRGGRFEWSGSTCVPDSVTTFAAAGGACWTRQTDGRLLRAEWTEAVPGDGLDDRVALDRLFTIALARSSLASGDEDGGTLIELGPGVYDVSALCGPGEEGRVFAVPSGVTLRGAGPGLTTIRLIPGSYPSDCAVLAVRQTVPRLPAIRGVVIEDLAIDMSVLDAPLVFEPLPGRNRFVYDVDRDQSPGIEIAGFVQDVDVRRVHFRNLHTDAIRILGSAVNEIVYDTTAAVEVVIDEGLDDNPPLEWNSESKRRAANEVTVLDYCDDVEGVTGTECVFARPFMLGDWTELITASEYRQTNADSTAGYHTVQRVRIDNVYVETALRNGISIQGGVRDVVISNSTFRRYSDQALSAEPTGTRSAPMDIRLLYNVMVPDTTFESGGSTAIAFGGAPNWNPGRRLWVEGNYVAQGSTGNSVEIHQWVGATVRGNEIEGGVMAFGRSGDIHVVGNTISYAGAEGVPTALVTTTSDATYGVEDLWIVDNDLDQRDSTANVGGLSILDASGVVIRGNRVTSASGLGFGLSYRLTATATGLAPVTSGRIESNMVEGFATGISVQGTSAAAGLIRNVQITGNTLLTGTPATQLTGIHLNSMSSTWGAGGGAPVISGNVFGAGVTTTMASSGSPGIYAVAGNPGGGIAHYRGTGSPEGVLAAAPGSQYTDTSGNGVLWYKDSGTSTTGWTSYGGGKSASATYDAPSIAAGAQTTTDVVVTGSQPGDFCEVSFSVNLSALSASCYVPGSNNARVVLRNGTGSAVDLASATVRVHTRRP